MRLELIDILFWILILIFVLWMLPPANGQGSEPEYQVTYTVIKPGIFRTHKHHGVPVYYDRETPGPAICSGCAY